MMSSFLDEIQRYQEFLGPAWSYIGPTVSSAILKRARDNPDDALVRMIYPNNMLFTPEAWIDGTMDFQAYSDYSQQLPEDQVRKCVRDTFAFRLREVFSHVIFDKDEDSYMIAKMLLTKDRVEEEADLCEICSDDDIPLYDRRRTTCCGKVLCIDCCIRHSEPLKEQYTCPFCNRFYALRFVPPYNFQYCCCS